jgi:hypothetical protein
LPPTALPPSASSNKVKLDIVSNDDMVTSATLSQALLLPPTDTTTLPDGSPSTLVMAMNKQLEELAHYHNDIAMKYNKMHALVTEARELTDEWVIKQKVQLAVTACTNTFQETVALAASSLYKQGEQTAQLLAEARDIVKHNNLHQLITVVVDSAITATLATPDLAQQLDLLVAPTLATPAFSQQLDAVIATKVMAQVNQYIDCATHREVAAWVEKQLDNVFNSFLDAVLKQQQEVKVPLPAA